MVEHKGTVFLVDDEAAVLRSISGLLRAVGYETRSYTSSQEFLAVHDPALPGCAIFDLSMPELDGLQLQAALTERGVRRPVIFLTGRGDIPKTVAAMKGGAVDFLTKPVRASELLPAVEKAVAQNMEDRHEQTELASIRDRIAQLTSRQREVMLQVVAGRLNKQIAGDLGTVEKTVKVHRGRMMAKMGVRTVAELVRLAERAGIATSG